MGMMGFAESNVINSIHMKQNHPDMLKVNVATSPLMSKDINVKISDIYSVVDINSNQDSNNSKAVIVMKHFDKETQKHHEEPLVLALPGDAFKDEIFLEWLLSR